MSFEFITYFSQDEKRACKPFRDQRSQNGNMFLNARSSFAD